MAEQRERVRGGAERGRLLVLGCLATILVAATLLRSWALTQNGFSRTYYAAGVRSQLQSWHNLLFNAFDPAGFVSIDKPPFAIWLQTLGARVVGFSELGVLLPQVVAGVLSILLLFIAVRRLFGRRAALAASAVLSVMPAAVAVDRSNNTESLLILVLLGAALLTVQAAATERPRILMAAMALIGIGFNVKMAAAWALAPTLLVAYVAAGGRDRVARRVRHAMLAGLLALPISLSWSILYDLTPKEGRPYVGGTTTNSMLELALYHNGLARFIPTKALDNRPSPEAAPAATNAPRPRLWDDSPTGPFRLLRAEQAVQFAWLLPLAIMGLWLGWRRTAGGSPETECAERAAMSVWTGWLATFGVIFSFAGGVFHTYYLALLGPPFAALAGIAIAHLSRRKPAGHRLLLPGVLVASVVWQLALVAREAGLGPDQWTTWIAVAALGICLAAAVGWHHHRGSVPLAAMTFAALLVLPTLTAASVVVRRPNPAVPVASLAALQRPDTPPDRRRAELTARSRAKLLAFLTSQHQGERYLVAVPNAHIAAPLIVASGDSVLTLGGYTGSDPIVTPAALEAMVKDGRLRFVMTGGFTLSPSPSRYEAEIADWARRTGKPVDAALWRLSGRTPPPTYRVEIGGEWVTMTTPEVFDMRR